MEYRLEDLSKNNAEGFKKDLCNRRELYTILKRTIEAFGSGCVISINGRWGCGKSTFLNMFEDQMKNDGYNIIHFNAWEDDYLEDPLPALIGGFYNITGPDNIDTKSLFISSTKALFKALPKSAVKQLEKSLNIDLQEFLNTAKDELSNNLDKALEYFKNRKNTIDEFKRKLADYAKVCSPDKPLIYVIDELDRCNPTYAVKTLERIKHLFAVDNVDFIFAIDCEQLCNSIKGYFGSDKFDADNYLKRFFDIQYDIPKLGGEDLLEKAMIRFKYQDQRNCQCEYKFDEIKDFILLLYQETNMSIRELEKFLLYTKIVLSTNCYAVISPFSIILLVYLKMFHSHLYTRFTSLSDLSLKEFIDYIETNFSENVFIREDNAAYFSFLIALRDLILSRYNDEISFNINSETHIVTNKIDTEQLWGNIERAYTVDKYIDINSLRKLVEISDSFNFKIQ